MCNANITLSSSSYFGVEWARPQLAICGVEMVFVFTITELRGKTYDKERAVAVENHSTAMDLIKCEKRGNDEEISCKKIKSAFYRYRFP